MNVQIAALLAGAWRLIHPTRFPQVRVDAIDRRFQWSVAHAGLEPRRLLLVPEVGHARIDRLKVDLARVVVRQGFDVPAVFAGAFGRRRRLRFVWRADGGKGQRSDEDGEGDGDAPHANKLWLPATEVQANWAKLSTKARATICAFKFA